MVRGGYSVHLVGVKRSRSELELPESLLAFLCVFLLHVTSSSLRKAFLT